MNLKKVDSFLSRLSLTFRRFYLDMRLTYDFSDNDETVQVTISKVKQGAGVSLVPSAIFSINDTSVRFLKLDMSSDIDFVDYEVSSFFELRTVTLYVVFSLLHAEHKDLTLLDFLSKITGSRFETGGDLLEYFLKINSLPYAKDPDYVYVYDYGNFQFYADAISFLSTQSARVVYKTDSEFSVFSTVCLVFEGIYAALLPANSMDDEAKVFINEDPFDQDAVAPPAEGEEGFAGDFGGGDFGGGDMGAGGGNSSAPVEGGGEGGGFGGFGSEVGGDSGFKE